MNSSPRWLPLRAQNIEFGYEENPLFSGFELNLSQRGFYRLTSKGHVNGPLYLMRFLAGLTAPREGHCFAGEECLSEMSFEEFLPWAKTMGYAFEGGGLLANKTVRDNLLLPLQYHQRASRSECFQKVDALIQRYELSPWATSRPADIPPSDYKMTVLVRAIVHDPKILFLAGPDEGLEPHRFLRFAEDVQRTYESGSLEAVLYTSQTSFNFSQDHQFEVWLEPHGARVGEAA